MFQPKKMPTTSIDLVSGINVFLPSIINYKSCAREKCMKTVWVEISDLKLAIMPKHINEWKKVNRIEWKHFCRLNDASLLVLLVFQLNNPSVNIDFSTFHVEKIDEDSFEKKLIRNPITCTSEYFHKLFNNQRKAKTFVWPPSIEASLSISFLTNSHTLKPKIYFSNRIFNLGL